MKNSILIAITLLMSIAAYAELPPKLELEMQSRPATAIFKAMDRFLDSTDPDAVSEIIYDCWDDGHKEFTRKIEIDLNRQPAAKKAAYQKAFKEFGRAYDASVPERRSTTVENDSISVRVYQDRLDLKSRSMNDSVGKSARMEDQEGAMAIIREDNILTIAQTFSINTNRPEAEAAKACNDTLSTLFHVLEQADTNSITAKRSFTAETKSSGILRVRSQLKVNDVTTGQLLGISDGDLDAIWQKIFSTYMSFIGADADISLTYQRKNRMLTLYSPTSRQINAACFKDGMICLFSGTYVGDKPYLPANWTQTTLVRTIKNGRVTTTKAFISRMHIR